MDYILILKYLLFSIYYVFLALLVIVTVLNTKTLRFKYKFDSLPIVAVLYIFHLYVTMALMKGGIYLLAPTTLILFPIVVHCYKIQIVGVTGSIGSGKSTVTKVLNEEFKLPLIDCDRIARRVVEVGKPAYKKIVKVFGDKILNPENKEIDRKALGAIVFNDAKLRRKLTSITGWYIGIEILKEVFVYSYYQKEPIVLDAPILFETKYLQWICFPIIVVYVTDESKQIKRVMKRDGLKEEEVAARMNSQMPTSKKLAMANIKLANDKEISDLRFNLINQLYPYML